MDCCFGAILRNSVGYVRILAPVKFKALNSAYG
jgi:hypothetical protein